MALFSLGRFFVAAIDFVQLPPGLRRLPGPEAKLHRAYHRRIVTCGAIGALVGALAGLGSDALAAASGSLRSGEDVFLLLAVPVITSVAGLLAGVGLACGLASVNFLQGPLGARWMGLVGTSSPEYARAIAIVIALLGTAFCVAMLILASLEKF